MKIRIIDSNLKQDLTNIVNDIKYEIGQFNRMMKHIQLKDRISRTYADIGEIEMKFAVTADYGKGDFKSIKEETQYVRESLENYLENRLHNKYKSNYKKTYVRVTHKDYTLAVHIILTK